MTSWKMMDWADDYNTISKKQAPCLASRVVPLLLKGDLGGLCCANRIVLASALCFFAPTCANEK